MTKEIKTYLAYIESFLSEGRTPDEYADFRQKLMIRIGFYQHERLIHLIVTALFAVLTILSLVGALYYPPLWMLFALFLVLLIPYVFHYYFLENSVQKMYRIYYDCPTE